MKLQVLCDCDDNKVCVGNFDGKPMWHYKSVYNRENILTTIGVVPNSGRIIPKSEWSQDPWMVDEAYKQNSD